MISDQLYTQCVVPVDPLNTPLVLPIAYLHIETKNG